MAEYIESICRRCFHAYVCEQFNEHRGSNNEKCHFFNDHFVPAADVVPVVRCKDCKYSVEIGSYGCYCRKEDSPWFNDTFEVYMDVDDFCSYGERKE